MLKYYINELISIIISMTIAAGFIFVEFAILLMVIISICCITVL